MVSCLITGGTGFLGRHVVRGFTRMAYAVTLLARRPVDGYRTVVADLALPVRPFPDGPYDEVYHLAGLAHQVPRSKDEGARFFEVNTEGTRRLLAALECLSSVPVSFVFVSSVAVYGLEEGILLEENTPRRARDPYGASKREAEDLVMEWCSRHNVRACVVRLPLVVGEGAPGNWRTMVHAMQKGRYWGIAPGGARRSMVAVADVCRILPKAAQTGGIFHLTDGYHPSFAELEAALAGVLGRKPPKRIPRWTAELAAGLGDAVQRVAGIAAPINGRVLRKMTSTLTFSDAKARQVLGWNPSPVLDRLGELLAA